MTMPSEDRLFKRFLVGSLLLHLGAYALSWLKPPYPKAALNDEQEIETELFTDFDGGAKGNKSVLPRADIAAKAELSAQTLPQLPKQIKLPEEGGPPDEIPAEKATVAPTKPENSKEKAGQEQKLKTLQVPKPDALEMDPNEALRRAALEALRRQAKPDTKKNLAPEESKVAEVGDDEAASKARKARQEYFSQVATNTYKTRIKAAVHYELPNTYQHLQGKLVVEIKLVISANGHIQTLELEKESGDSNFDRIVLTAVRDGAPYPKPPKHLTGVAFALQFTP